VGEAGRGVALAGIGLGGTGVAVDASVGTALGGGGKVGITTGVAVGRVVQEARRAKSRIEIGMLLIRISYNKSLKRDPILGNQGCNFT
jgi:hypothetical protein